MSRKKRIRAPRVRPQGAASAPVTPSRAWLWWVLAAALCVRVAYLLASREQPFFEPRLLDPEYYDQWARRIAAGGAWAEGVFYGLPLYPLFLGAVYAVGGAGVIAAKAAQHLLGLVTVYFVARTAERMSGRPAAIGAAVLAAAYGPMFFHESVLVPEALAMPLYAALVWLTLRVWDEPGLKRAAAWGALAAACALTKAGILVFVPVGAAALWLRKRRAEALVAVAVLLACLAPVTLHNRLRGGDWVWLTSHSGFNLYIGNNPRAEGVFTAPEGTGSNVETQIADSKRLAEEAAGRPLKPSEVSRYWSGRAWSYISSDPARFAWLCARKALLFFDSREISDVDDYAFGKTLVPYLALPWPDFAWLGPLFFAAWGAGASFRRKRVVGALFVCYLAGTLLYFVNARYRLPMLAVMIPVAGAGLAGIARAWHERRTGTLLACALLAAAGAWVGHLQLVGLDPAGNLVNAGDALLKSDRIDESVAFYRRAIEANPRSAKAHLAMGLAMTRQGRRREAADYYLKTLEIDPRSGQAYNNLGMWHDAEGRLEEAEACFRRSIETGPGSYQARNNLGMTLAKQGRIEEAAESFESALEIYPRYARALTNLGLIRYRQGRVDEARRRWTEALAADPSYMDARRALALLESRQGG